MKGYTIYANIQKLVTLTVEAEDFEDAWKKAIDTPDHRWEDEGIGDIVYDRSLCSDGNEEGWSRNLEERLLL